jgi:hypothetical protein
MKIIMPANNDPRSYSEAGLIGKIISNHGLEAVKLGQVSHTWAHSNDIRSDLLQGNLDRTLYYKDGYLVDFPRTLNRLSNDDDRVRQGQHFKKVLENGGYFKSQSSGNGPLATATSWEDFVKFAPANGTMASPWDNGKHPVAQVQKFRIHLKKFVCARSLFWSGMLRAHSF